MPNNNPAKHTPTPNDALHIIAQWEEPKDAGYGMRSLARSVLPQSDVLVAQIKRLREALANFTAAAEGLMSAGDSEDEAHGIFEEPVRKAIQVLRETERE